MRRARPAITIAVVSLVLAAPAAGDGAKPLAKCAPDAVVSGTVCMDRFEASVWRVPDPNGANKGLVKKIRNGKATMADLAKGGATQLGVTGDDYAPCADNGENCTNDVFALSLLQVTPSSDLTWFQAQVACKNSAKRLPSNAEWQAAVVGTPDPGPDDDATDCRTSPLAFDVGATGSRSACVSLDGAFDMVGNLSEWTADWVPRTETCGTWSEALSTTDFQCLSNVAVTGEPGVPVRGGVYNDGDLAGPFAVNATVALSVAGDVGFRCAR